ncbi:XRE family transcriptional regulator [Pseudonocardia sp. MH-G8]|uniref:XRE family transcriptional regulator n=1 Tax=Pseudonocardia sp. MH-G8 TaxID=1854588 RepID=UPI001304499B|nr:XRE family transcriptional regulator [Pseudonocardia sp. MH-G8]
MATPGICPAEQRQGVGAEGGDVTSSEATSEEPWGVQLRRWRDETMRWSQQELVDNIIKRAFESNEDRGTRLDTRLVGRWEGGTVARPQAVYRRLLGQLGAPLPLTSPRPAIQTAPRLPADCPPSAPALAIASSSTGSVGTTTEDGEGWMLRRDFLRAGSAMAVGGLLAAGLGVGASGRASVDVVDELRRRLVGLRALDVHMGGADTYGLYAAEAQVSSQMLRTASPGESVRRELLALHAEQSQQAGWAAFDAGWHDLARAHYVESHSAADEAGEPGLAGNALALHAYQLIALDRPARVLSEKSVLAAQQDGVEAGVRVLLHSRAAWTFALDGDVEATASSLGLAEEALAERSNMTPDYAAWVDETELAIMSGRCWSELRRPLRAVPVLESALGRYSNIHARDKALYSSWLADSYIDAGEIEQAAAVTRSSLEIMGDVASVRPRQRLAAVANRLTPHRDLSVVRDLLSSDALNPRDVRS